MNKGISTTLKELRESKNLTQIAFGKELGMSRSKISSWETGRRDLSIYDAIAICDFYDISLDGLLNPNNISEKKLIDFSENYIKKYGISLEEKQKRIKQINESFKNIF